MIDKIWASEVFWRQTRKFINFMIMQSDAEFFYSFSYKRRHELIIWQLKSIPLVFKLYISFWLTQYELLKFSGAKTMNLSILWSYKVMLSVYQFGYISRHELIIQQSKYISLIYNAYISFWMPKYELLKFSGAKTVNL